MCSPGGAEEGLAVSRQPSDVPGIVKGPVWRGEGQLVAGMQIAKKNNSALQ